MAKEESQLARRRLYRCENSPGTETLLISRVWDSSLTRRGGVEDVERPVKRNVKSWR